MKDVKKYLSVCLSLLFSLSFAFTACSPNNQGNNSDINNDGVVDEEEKKIKEAENYKAPTQTQKQGALKAYNEGGQAAYEEYLEYVLKGDKINE